MIIRTLLSQIHSCMGLALPFVRKLSLQIWRWGNKGLALIGLTLFICVLILATQKTLLHEFEAQTAQWLMQRHNARQLEYGNVLESFAELNAVQRVTAINPSSLKRPQWLITKWLTRRYKVAPEPLARIVQEAWAIGSRAKLEPELLLAIIAIESRFNPYAQSSVGAQGLTQVMTHVHIDKFQTFGGAYAVFDPLSNLKVGTQILKDCISKMGSIQDGLSCYVGASGEETNYSLKVLAEFDWIKKVSSGQKISPRIEYKEPPTTNLSTKKSVNSDAQLAFDPNDENYDSDNIPPNNNAP